MTERYEQLHARFRAAGQGHVFAFWDRLGPAERTQLLEEAAALDLEQVARLGALLKQPSPAASAAPALEPPTVFPLQRSAAQKQHAAEARRLGEELLGQGRVGYLVVAGGQGSRLGFEGPKGVFPVGPVSGCSLFEWHARRLLAARTKYAAPPCWYVMTSATNDRDTREFFARQRYFGLAPEDVFFFQQRMLPALDRDGRILLRQPHALFLAPNGHGGTLEALRSSGALAHARRCGIEQLSYFQVDNPLARPADPLFLGLHHAAQAKMSSKVVEKRDAWEKVGVLGRLGGALGCIEYSDLPDDLRHATDSQGKLLFRAGNIAMHVLERAFIEQLTEGELQLPWHLARKKMTVLGAHGDFVDTDGVKFETFVFDALARSPQSITLEVAREHEFSPIKNQQGEDSPHSARRDLTRLFHGWVKRAGLPEPQLDEAGHHRLEVDPRLAEEEAEFLARKPVAAPAREGGHLYT